MHKQPTVSELLQQGFSKTFTKRFWSKVNKDGPIPPHCPELGKCWEWIAGLLWDGYGQIGKAGRGSKKLRAHRVSWFLFNGDIPDGKLVMHKCDNTRCVNPSHLRIGTVKDNSDDAMKKGRLKPMPIMIGEENGSSKLTWKSVDEIRKLYSSGGISQESLGKIYHVDQTIISDVVRFETWKTKPHKIN